MNTPDPRLVELLEAANEVLVKGASAARRTRLREAVDAVPRLVETLSMTRPLPTPAVVDMLNRAVGLANASNDICLRLQHIDFALKETPQ